MPAELEIEQNKEESTNQLKIAKISAALKHQVTEDIKQLLK